MQVERIFKDEATEEKGERARLVCYCFFPWSGLCFSMDADVFINVCYLCGRKFYFHHCVIVIMQFDHKSIILGLKQ